MRVVGGHLFLILSLTALAHTSGAVVCVSAWAAARRPWRRRAAGVDMVCVCGEKR